MLTYEECKAIAMEKSDTVGFPINRAGELPTAYVFDNSEIEVVGRYPFVIEKETGEHYNYWPYLRENNYTEYDIKDIDF